MPTPQGRPLLVVILAWNRPESLRRLLASLERADYGDAPAPIEVRFALDHTGNETLDGEMDAVIDALRWPHGDVLVRRRTAHAGLRVNILGSWTGAEGRPGVMLEDDIELSSFWWQWTQAGLARYAGLPAVVGVSLFTPDDMNEAYENGGSHGANGKWVPSCGWQSTHYRKSAPETTASAVLWGQPCSWGAVLLPEHWRRFQARADALRRASRLPELRCPEGKDARTCRVVANRWGRNSWKRLLILHMVEQGLVMAYPNLPQRTAFSTNHVEPGLHNVNLQALAGQRARHRMPLVDARFCAAQGLRCRADLDGDGGPSDEPPPFALPAADEIAAYDFYCARQPPGAAGFEAMAAAGERVLAQHTLELVDELPAEDPSDYVVRRLQGGDREL